MYMNLCMSIHISIYIYMYIYISIYVYLHIPIYLCVCVYIHVQIHTQMYNIYSYMSNVYTRPSIYPPFFIPTWNFSFPNSKGANYFIFYVSFGLCALLPFVSFVISFQQAGACRTPVQIWYIFLWLHGRLMPKKTLCRYVHGKTPPPPAAAIHLHPTLLNAQKGPC